MSEQPGQDFSTWRAPQEGAFSLYRERESEPETLQANIEYIKRLMHGEIEPVELDPEALERVAQLEGELGAELEAISSRSEKVFSLYPEYFLTSEGAQHYKKLFASDEPEHATQVANYQDQLHVVQPGTTEEAKRTLLRLSAELDATSAQTKKEIFGASLAYARTRFVTEYEAAQGDLSKVSDVNRLSIVTKPEELLAKVKELRAFKQKLRSIEGESADSDTSEMRARQAVRRLYQRRANLMIASSFDSVALVAQKRAVVGAERLSSAEQEILTLTGVTGMSSEQLQRSLDRYDKFTYGATRDYAVRRNPITEEPLPADRVQVSQEMHAKADAALQFYLTDRLKNLDGSTYKERGLDRAKVDAKTFSAEELENVVRQLLREYGLESSDPYDPETPEKLPSDGKLRVYRDPARETMAVGDSLTVFIPAKLKTSIERGLPTAMHELTHGLQKVARHKASKRELRIFRKLGVGRSEIVVEGGAMLTEWRVRQELFGTAGQPFPYYITGMSERLRGGSFKDVFKAMDDQAMRVVEAEHQAGIVSDDKLQAKRLEMHNFIFPRAMRFFANAIPLDSRVPYFRTSKESVYIEQEDFMRQLTEAGVEDFHYLHVHPDAARDLVESGLWQVDFKNIQKLDLADVRKLWDGERDKYAL